jgi:hypothetical protein
MIGGSVAQNSSAEDEAAMFAYLREDYNRNSRQRNGESGT